MNRYKISITELVENDPDHNGNTHITEIVRLEQCVDTIDLPGVFAAITGAAA